MAETLTHFDPHGRARMVDVSAKAITTREAHAQGRVRISTALGETLRTGNLEKGDAFTVAKVAGILAAKRTGELIPLCHPLPLEHVQVELELDVEQREVRISAVARTAARTGVEMEALTAVSLAALTFYDMCKALDPAMVIDSIYLVEKRGGRRGLYRNESPRS